MPEKRRDGDRDDRIRAWWRQMQPATRERAWGRLDPEQRVECLRVLFDGIVEPDRLTSAG